MCRRGQDRAIGPKLPGAGRELLGNASGSGEVVEVDTHLLTDLRSAQVDDVEVSDVQAP